MIRFQKSRRKLRVSTIVIDSVLAVFFIFIVVLMVKHNVKMKEEGEKIFGGFKYEVMENGVALTEYMGSGEQPEIPTEIEGKPVVSIAENCFSGNVYMRSVTIPKSIWGIGIGAFKGCINLETITVEEGVEMIASYAFQNCKGLKNVVLPKSMESIGLEAFADTSDFTIVGFEGSEAESFAAENGIAFEKR